MRQGLVAGLAAALAAGLGGSRAHAQPNAPDADLAALAAGAPGCPRAPVRCLGVRLHVAMRAGAPVVGAPWVAAQLAEAARHFAPLGVGWQVVSVAALPEERAIVEDALERTALAAVATSTDLEVVVTGRLADLDEPGGEIRGVAWPARRKKLVILSAIAPPIVLAHELGHVLGLPHSGYPGSLMNKRPRSEPPLAERTFHPRELAAMRPVLAQLLRGGALVARPSPGDGPSPGPTPARAPDRR